MKTEIEHRTWGGWPSIRLATTAVELEVVADVGARIVSLRDRRSQREWLVQGEPPIELEQMEWAREDVSFGGRESYGWDECLPTTSVCPDPLATEGAALRDHGDQWGRRADLSLDSEKGAVVHTWDDARWGYRFSRRISFEDEQAVLVEYILTSLTDKALPIHWAQHPVLRLEPGSYLDLPDVTRVRRSWQQGIDLPDEMPWPTATTTDGRELDLACVRQGEGWASVLYAQPHEEIRAVAPNGARLDMDWDRAFAPALRIWLAYGGWPPGGPPAEQVALEPCTSMHDDLRGALEAGHERIVEPGAELRWWVRLRLSK